MEQPRNKMTLALERIQHQTTEITVAASETEVGFVGLSTEDIELRPNGNNPEDPLLAVYDDQHNRLIAHCFTQIKVGQLILDIEHFGGYFTHK
ncbi:hypothetical protein H7171_01600 [Candidatus Saccharibacteria bacterium]|nr:hypothetical protein [Candidatus Saccharibacteria bacterium]